MSITIPTTLFSYFEKWFKDIRPTATDFIWIVLSQTVYISMRIWVVFGDIQKVPHIPKWIAIIKPFDLIFNMLQFYKKVINRVLATSRGIHIEFTVSLVSSHSLNQRASPTRLECPIMVSSLEIMQEQNIHTHFYLDTYLLCIIIIFLLSRT